MPMPMQHPEQFANVPEAKAQLFHVAGDPNSLVYKLVEIMKAVDHVDKQGTAPAEAGGYAYMMAKDIAHAFRKEFTQRGILCMGSVIHTERWQDLTKGGKPVQGIDVTMRFTFYDQLTGEQMSVDAVGSGLGGDKAAYKAQTGALKYALRSAFLVPDAAADAEADEPTADTHEYVKAPQRLSEFAANAAQQPRHYAADPEVDQFAGEEYQNAPERPPASSERYANAPAPTRPGANARAYAPAKGQRSYGPPRDAEAKITDPQKKRLFAISREAGLSDDDVHEIIAPFGYTSMNDVQKGNYDKICAIVQSGGIR